MWKGLMQEFYQKQEQESGILTGYGSYNGRQIQRMTHMEIFDWPVHRAPEDLAHRKPGQKKTALLFDYQKRNPLDDNAAVYVVDLEDLT